MSESNNDTNWDAGIEAIFTTAGWNETDIVSDTPVSHDSETPVSKITRVVTSRVFPSAPIQGDATTTYTLLYLSAPRADGVLATYSG